MHLTVTVLSRYKAVEGALVRAVRAGGGEVRACTAYIRANVSVSNLRVVPSYFTEPMLNIAVS